MLILCRILKILKRVVYHPIKAIESIVTVSHINKMIKAESIKVLFYDRFRVHSVYSSPVLDNFLKVGGTALYVVGEKEHPALDDTSKYPGTIYLDKAFELFFRFIKVPLIITPASGFSPDAKHSHTKVGHIYHSPVSMHYIYGDKPFDGYDIFFAVGPHHVREVELLSALRGWEGRRCFQSGYPRIDIISKEHRKIEVSKEAGTKGTIAFAPSWGENNILRSHGLQIIKSLLDNQYRVILRPHKHSFDFDMDVIEEANNAFKKLDFELDETVSFAKIYSCDILISDWSGIAYEFAFALGKPVVSVDVKGGQKIQSVLNTKIDARPMEDVCRYEIGIVSQPENVCAAVTKLIEEKSLVWAEKTKSARDKYLYNFGRSSKVIAEQIMSLIEP